MVYPRISIITPTFNSEAYLEETILSVLSQNYPNLEYIIIDGGSSDGTKDIIKKYEGDINFWISEPDNGMYYAIQKGFNESTGEIMAWLNSDDKYQLGALHVVANIFTDLNEVEWILGMPSLYNSEGFCVKVDQARRWSNIRFWLKDYRWIQQENVFWKRSLWEKAGNHLNLSYKFASDFELWCRFFQSAQLYNVCTTLSGFRLHGNQISLKFGNEYEKEVTEINKLYPSRYSFKYIIIKQLWATKVFCAKFKVLKNIAIFLIFMVDKLISYPGNIYYDFAENRWKK